MKKQAESNDENPYNIFYDNYLDTKSCTECTGLMYRAANNRKEWDSYREVYDFTPKPPKSSDKQDLT